MKKRLSREPVEPFTYSIDATHEQYGSYILRCPYMCMIINSTATMSHAELNAYLRSKGFAQHEGNSGQIQKQTLDLKSLVQSPDTKRVMEIGFNAGHSAVTFLSANPRIHLVSFDLGDHEYVKHAKAYIDKAFPGRHSLHLGSSIDTVPEYTKSHEGDPKFDVIFIDGGHLYPIARRDIKNCRELAHSKTTVIIDDIVYHPKWHASWSIGPTCAWRDFVDTNQIVEFGHRFYNYRGRGISWGRYVFQ